MRHVLRLLVVAVIVTTVLTFVGRAKPAHAECAITSGTNPPSSSLLAFLITGHLYKLVSTGISNSTKQFVPPFTDDYLVPIDTNSTLTVFDENADCGSAGPAVTSFNPGDARINGQPGDRLAVYCNASATPPNVDVWVIDNGGTGHELAKLTLSDLTSVAAGKFAKNLGTNGVIFAGSDASGNGYAALQGGPYSGTATGDWLKTFSCKASS